MTDIKGVKVESHFNLNFGKAKAKKQGRKGGE